VPDNKLYYGDNLDVLRRYVRDESVDLVYLDPPFNSRQDYNVLFAEKDGTRAAAQIMAFEDTWEWNIDAEKAYQEIVERGGRISDAMRAFRTFLGNSDMMAYLAMMAPRLVEFPRIQILTVEQLLKGEQMKYPRWVDATFKKAPRAREKEAVNMALPLGATRVDDDEPEEPF